MSTPSRLSTGQPAEASGSSHVDMLVPENREDVAPEATGKRKEQLLPLGPLGAGLPPGPVKDDLAKLDPENPGCKLLMAGYLAHEFFEHGTLFTEPVVPKAGTMYGAAETSSEALILGVDYPTQLALSRQMKNKE